MKAFSFPSGPISISKEELELAFSKFEKVEIPGSVFRFECNFDEMKSPLLVNELVLNEGICEITMLGSRLVSFNIPSTTKTLRIERYNGVQGMTLPKVLCLPEGFEEFDGTMTGVTHLQVHHPAAVRLFGYHGMPLQHYVILGNKLSL